MQVKDVMTDKAIYIPTTTSLEKAAQMMRDMDCGFLPLGDSEQGKLQGVITDRDITIRGIAEGKDPTSTQVDQIKTYRVLYCYQTDELADAAKRMQDQQVYRLVVLDNHEHKHICGIVSLGDIVRHNESQIAADTAKAVAA